jgi:hypothetical protein
MLVVLYQSAWLHIAEDTNLPGHGNENLKLHIRLKSHVQALHLSSSAEERTITDVITFECKNCY